MDDVFLTALKSTLKERLNFQLENYKEIKAGGNNKLFCLHSGTSKLLLKIYNSHDDRQRLKREFQAYSFLNSNGFDCLPKAYFKDNEQNYGIYSFEIGKSKPANEVTKQDLDKMVSFIVSLQNIKQDTVNEKFLPGVMACFSFQDYLNNIYYRIDKFQSSIKKEGLSEHVKQLLQDDYLKQINDLIQGVIKDYSQDELKTPIKQQNRRLSPVDFGPHNTIFKDDGKLIFVDFEYFGWDDPNRLTGDFVNHDQTLGISEEKKKYFLDKYQQLTTIDDEIIQRLETVKKLIAIEWLTVYLSSLASDKIQIRKFADTDFNEEEYIRRQVTKYKLRLKSLKV